MTNPDHSKGMKPEKFSGTYFKRWAHQMKYWLTTLGLILAIDNSIRAPLFKSSPAQSSAETFLTPSSYIYLKSEKIDYHCLPRILNALSDSLYDIL